MSTDSLGAVLYEEIQRRNILGPDYVDPVEKLIETIDVLDRQLEEARRVAREYYEDLRRELFEPYFDKHWRLDVQSYPWLELKE